MDNSTSQFYNPEPATPKSKKSKMKLVIFLVVLIIIAAVAIFGTMRFLEARDSALDVTPTPTEEFFIPTEPPLPTEEPQDEASTSATPSKSEDDETTATPTKSANAGARTGVTIEVLNGSGVSGAAGKMKTLLESAGYTVSSTGNADNYDYQKTVVVVKSGKKSILPTLVADVEKEYVVGSSSATFTGSTDAQVIVGKE